VYYGSIVFNVTGGKLQVLQDAVKTMILLVAGIFATYKAYVDKGNAVLKQIKKAAETFEPPDVEGVILSELEPSTDNIDDSEPTYLSVKVGSNTKIVGISSRVREILKERKMLRGRESEKETKVEEQKQEEKVESMILNLIQ